MTSHDLYHSRVVPLCPVNSGATAPLKSVVATDTTEEAVKLHDGEKLSAESRANDIHRRGICCDSGDKKLSLSNNDEAPSDEVSAPLDLSDALRVLTSRRESGACSVDTRHRGGGIGSEFCLGVDASVWAVQSCCCCCCWSQAGQSTPGHLTATEGVRGVCFQINKKAL